MTTPVKRKSEREFCWGRLFLRLKRKGMDPSDAAYRADQAEVRAGRRAQRRVK